MFALSNKVLLKVGSFALLTATGTGIYFLSSNNSSKRILDNIEIKEKTVEREEKANNPMVEMSNLLNADKRILLRANEDSDNSIWKENWQKFKQKYNRENIENSSWNFTGFLAALDHVIASASFKELCEKNSKIKVNDSNDRLYLDVKEFCTKEAT